MSKKELDFDDIPNKAGISQDAWKKAKIVSKGPSEWVMKNIGIVIMFIVTILGLGIYAIAHLFIEYTQTMCASTFAYLFILACYSWIRKIKNKK